MFEPKTYQDKRAALNEMAVQQLMNLVLRTADPTTQAQVQMMMEQYGIGHQRLRDAEAERVLGPVVEAEGAEYMTAQTILDYLKANVGRTYFGTEEHTDAPEGSIGTAGFGKKFKEWLAELPEYDTVLSKDIVSGFYRDTASIYGQTLPLLVIRHGDEITVTVFNRYVSVMTLNLAHVPAEYNWANKTHQVLRGELFTYRGNLTKAEFKAELAAALSAQGVTTFSEPVPHDVTIDLSQVEEAGVVEQQAAE